MGRANSPTHIPFAFGYSLLTPWIVAATVIYVALVANGIIERLPSGAIRGRSLLDEARTSSSCR